MDLLPAEMLLQVKQENAGTPHSVLLMPNRSETVRFDWENPALSQEASDEEWKQWFEAQKQETLGITSYAPVYSFLYIEDHEVRHEILIPLATLNESISLKCNDDEFLDLNEQDAARKEIEAHFLEGNPIQIDGIEVSGNVDRLNFFGVDFKDFARQAPRKRVPMSSARVGIILSYPSTTPPQTGKLTWTRFSQFLRRVNLAVIAYDQTSSATLGRVDQSRFFEWKNPGRLQPNPISKIEATLPPRPTISLPLLSLSCLLLGIVSSLVLKQPGIAAKQRRVFFIGFILAALLSWPFLCWNVPTPFQSPPQVSADVADKVFSTLLQNIYAAFQFREESSLYDALANSIHVDLLSEVYVEIREGLVMQEQGGAVSRVGEVKILNGNRLAPEKKNLQTTAVSDIGANGM